MNNSSYSPMVWVKVSKLGSSWTGGMYPMLGISNRIQKLQAQGYKVVSVKQVA